METSIDLRIPLHWNKRRLHSTGHPWYRTLDNKQPDSQQWKQVKKPAWLAYDGVKEKRIRKHGKQKRHWSYWVLVEV